MPLPRFILGMIAVLIVFAATTFLLTHSLAITLVQTFISAVLIQAGYFITVLLMVRRESRKKIEGPAAKPEANTHPSLDKQKRPGQI
jgi:exopolysaccharide production repressor protein